MEAEPGPQPMSHAARLALAHEIAGRAVEACGDRLLAIGVYGSLARGADGPYSDIEMMCILRSSGEDYSYEWAYDTWKAEVDFISQDVLLQQAAEVELDWPRTHGSYTRVLPLYDPQEFFPRLAAAVFSELEARLPAVLQDVIVGELYEYVGKLRNAQASGNQVPYSYLAMKMAEIGAFLIGLDNRFLYTTGMSMFAESLALPGRPHGYDDLCRLVMNGDLGDPDRLYQACEALWSGVGAWAAEQGIAINHPQKIPF
jgi:kanamycin nucleotidyltransferase